MQYIISSLGRATTQKTLETLPTACLQQVELWVRPEERKLYKNQWYSSKVKAIKVWPTNIDCVSKKRMWLGNEYGSAFTLVDDDLSMYVWSKKASKFVRASMLPKLFSKHFLEYFPALFEQHKAVSLPMKLFADQKARQLEESGSLVLPNQLGFVFSGYSQGSLLDLDHKVFLFADLSLSLQQFIRSSSSVLYYGMCWQQSGAKHLASTGAATYRTELAKIDSALKMLKLFPGIVTGFKANKEVNGGGVSIQRQIRRIGKVTSEHKTQTKTRLRELLTENGLRKVPKIFDLEYDVSRQEIDQMIKSNWKAVKI